MKDRSLFFKAIVAGSITSSCCFIQLCINVLSSLDIIHVGCAGFNTILGPLRPYTRAVTISWLIMSWFNLIARGSNVHKNHGSSSGNDHGDEKMKSVSSCCNAPHYQHRKRRLLFSTILCISLMYMPEGLKLIGGPAIAPAVNHEHVVKLEFTIDNMGCEACVNAVENILLRQSAVISAKVSSFDLGEAEVYINDHWLDIDIGMFEQSMNDDLKKHGYELHNRGWKTKKMHFDESFVQHICIVFCI
mmetsp:Transcript_25777/g.29925  ORF Transcript_25777/g.29925 Transcript_25777/m.29925 type:complete len:246 (+) Transcript_25777:359-1096(+)